MKTTSLLRIASMLPLACVSPTASGAPLGDTRTVTLAPGETTAPLGDAFLVSFTRVLNDSRCPIDVMCVWSGNAAVEIGVGSSRATMHADTLNTAVQPHETIWGSYRITVLELAPMPRSGTPIPADGYRLTLRVQRFGGD